jgi:hypothetical protein
MEPTLNPFAPAPIIRLAARCALIGLVLSTSVWAQTGYPPPPGPYPFETGEPQTEVSRMTQTMPTPAMRPEPASPTGATLFSPPAENSPAPLQFRPEDDLSR